MTDYDLFLKNHPEVPVKDIFHLFIDSDFILAGFVALAVAGYLVYTLFHPEKF